MNKDAWMCYCREWSVRRSWRSVHLRRSRESNPQMTGLFQYILIRMDLPSGVKLAQTAHAAGEAFHHYSRDNDGDLNPTTGTTVIVLGVDNEEMLSAYAALLDVEQVPHVLFREPDAPYNGAPMALGTHPMEQAALAPYFASLQLAT